MNSSAGDTTLNPSSNDFESNVGATVFSLQFDLTRTATDSAQLLLKLTQGANTFTVTANGTSSIYNSIQRMAIRTDQKDGETGGQFYFDDIRLEVIPEPSTVGLSFLGVIAARFLRRRRA